MITSIVIGSLGLCGVVMIFLILCLCHLRGRRSHDRNYTLSREGYHYRLQRQSTDNYRGSSEIESPRPVWTGTRSHRHRFSTHEYMNPSTAPHIPVANILFDAFLVTLARLHPAELRRQEDIEMEVANLNRRVTSVHYPRRTDRHG